MTENQLYTVRNEQALSINPCDCASQGTVFDLEKYGPYLDKIRALFVPSLKYKIQSLLEEFVYSTDSRWAKQFPCFKKFVDAIIMWKDPLNRIAEYDISTMEETMRNTVKRVIKDHLITCFLDSVILHHRLNQVCRKLDALGIENNISRNLNVWNLVNGRDYLMDHNCFTNLNTTMDCNMNLNTVSCNTKRSIKCKKTVKSLAENDRNIEHMRPTTSEYREHEILKLNRNFLRQKEDNSNHYSTRVTIGSQNDSVNKMNKSFNEKSCNTESRKIRNDLKLKIIVHKICLEDYEYSTFSNITRLPLPCKPSNLVGRIFEADPSLTESCLIVMKRKFEDSMYNVCSCLNSVLEKLNIKLTKALCLNCEIYPGYISFKLKANNIKKYLFVARVPICQNVHKCTIQQDFSILSSNSKSSTEISESKCFEQNKDDGTNFNDRSGYTDEEAERLNTSYSQSDRSPIKDMAIDVSQSEAENINEKRITCITTENASKYVENLAISSCKDIVEEISNTTSCIDNSEEGNVECCKVLNSIEINCDECDDMDKSRENILESIDSIVKNGASTQSVNNTNCACLSENVTETDNEIEDIFSNKNLNSFSQITSTKEHDWICLSSKKSNLENEVCNTSRCSITSFVQNFEYDKQLVELNCNRFSNNNISMIDRQFDTQENNSSLNSTKVEIGCNSCCSCRRDDFIDITVIDDISKENIVCAFETSQSNFEFAGKREARSTDYSKTVQISSRSKNLLTISVQMPRSKILSRGINMDTYYPRAVWLTSADDKNIFTAMETRDRCNEIANLSTRTLIVSEKGSKIPPSINKEILDGTQDFITSPRFSVSKGRFRSNSRGSDISTGECLCAENHSTYATSSASLYCRSFATTSEFTMSDRQVELQKSKQRGRGCVRSRNGIRNVTSTTIKRRTASRRCSSDYPAEVRSQTILAMTKFRNSVDKSIDRIKRLFRTKLGRIMFNDKMSNKMTKTSWRNEESSEDTRRKKTSGKYIRQGCNVTSCSACDCRRQNCTASSRESSNMILSIRRKKGKRRCEENIKFRDHGLIDGNKPLLSFRSIETSPWSYNLPASATEEQKLNRNNRSRYNRRKEIGNVVSYCRNSHRCDLENSMTNVTISSQSTKVSLIENDSKYFGRYTCKRQEETCDNKCISKQTHNQDRRENEDGVLHEYGQSRNKNKYRHVPIKYSNVNSNESLKTSLSHAWRRNARKVHKQFYDISELRNVKRFAYSGKNQQIFEKDTSDRSNDGLRSNDNLRKRHVFATLTDACNDYMDDLELDFKLRLLRYVELCKGIKRSLMRTLQPDDIYKVSTASVSDSDF